MIPVPFRGLPRYPFYLEPRDITNLILGMCYVYLTV